MNLTPAIVTRPTNPVTVADIVIVPDTVDPLEGEIVIVNGDGSGGSMLPLNGTNFLLNGFNLNPLDPHLQSINPDNKVRIR